jgi:hypothetical protein
MNIMDLATDDDKKIIALEDKLIVLIKENTILKADLKEAYQHITYAKPYTINEGIDMEIKAEEYLEK